MKALLASVSLWVLLTVNALALAGKIGSPEIGHRPGIDEAQEKKVHGLIKYMDEDLKFIEGSFINQFSNQRLGGSSERTSRFIGMLKEVGIWDVEVRFQDFGEQETAFTLHQDSAETLNLCINSGRDDFRLKDFAAYLPQPGLGLGIRKAIQTEPEPDDAGKSAEVSAPESGDKETESRSEPETGTPAQ